MRWESGRRSDNVEDRRGLRIGRGIAGGGLGTIVIVLVALYLGVDPSTIVNMVPTGGGTAVEQRAEPRPAAENALAEFVSVVLASTEDTWGAVFREGGRSYAPPKLVLFTEAVDSACGMAGSATGPFYCPPDRKVYLDLSFFDDLRRRFGAPGDFAQAYVVAHEVGHHVQNLLGIEGKVRDARARAGKREANRLSVLLELQSDCLAGVWGNRANQSARLLEPGDLEEALRAAAAIGDDRLQRQGGGRVVPDSFTHGSSEQRVRWFRRGFESGDLGRCDTFAAREM
ncbi:MAG TPA: neutral zinc metallopeptidase [bacterium]